MCFVYVYVYVSFMKHNPELHCKHVFQALMLLVHYKEDPERLAK